MEKEGNSWGLWYIGVIIGIFTSLIYLLFMITAPFNGAMKVGATGNYTLPCSTTFTNTLWLDTVRNLVASGNSGIDFNATTNKILVYQSTNGNFYIQIWKTGEPKLRVNANGTVDFIRPVGSYVSGQLHTTTGDVVSTSMNIINVTSETTQAGPYLQLCGVTENITTIIDTAQPTAHFSNYFSHYSGTQTIAPMKFLQANGTEPQPPAPEPEPTPEPTTTPDFTQREAKLVAVLLSGFITYIIVKQFRYRR